MLDLHMTGKTVLITGASQGIGAGAARAFASEGCRLRLTARSVERLNVLKTEIEREMADAEVLLYPGDLTEDGAPERLAAAAGDVDVLINNAGVIPSGSLFDIDEAAWHAGWDLKVVGYVNMCRLYYPRMKAVGSGVIINNIGNGGEVTDPRYIEGGMGNSSLMHFTRSLGGASLADGIRVLGINPGPVATDRIYTMLKKRAVALFDEENRYRELEATYPRGRPAHVAEITDVMLFLASERAAYMSGTIVTVDGGIASRRSII